MERFAGRYQLLRSLGQGGMGTVWLALDLSNRTECVLKRLDPGVLRVAPDSLRREFELLARVRHPAVVGVQELGFAPDGAPYLTMEYVPGVSADHLARTWDTEALCFVGAYVAQGLEALHAAGVVHGDLKPSNLLLLPPRAGETLPAGVRLVDFGLASLLGRDVEGHRGTPGFAAPEVVRGEAPSVSSDLYGLGAMLYALGARRVTGEAPGSMSALRRQQNASPPAAALEEAGLAAPLVQLVLRLMAPSSAERPADAREVRRELERIHPAARRTLSERLLAETLVGRERELARLERLLRAGQSGPRLVLVAGEPGVGKTALLTDMSVRATLAGRAVVRLACTSADEPGAAAVALLRRLAAEAGAVTAGEEGSREALALLDQAEPGALSARSGEIVAAAGRWLAALQARERSPLILLDDCERMDSLSRGILRACVLDRGAGDARWVWAGRAEGATGHEDDRILVSAGHAVELVVASLDRAGARRLLEARIQLTPPDGLEDFLWSRSGGHPGLLVEALRAAADGGVLREDDEQLVLDPDGIARLPLPAGFEDSLLTRLAALPDAAREMAEALATLDRPASLEELRLLAPGVDDAAHESLLASGIATRLGPGVFGLRPPELSQRLLASLDCGRRRGLHRLALTIAALPAPERFRHLAGSGDPAGALAAAHEAFAAHPDERLAARAAELADSESPAEAAAWHETVGRLLSERGKHRAALPHLERSLQDFADAAARPRRWLLLTSALLRSDRPHDVSEAVRRALAEALPDHERSMLLVNDAAQLFSRGCMPEAEAAARAALERAEQVADAEAAGYSSLTLASVLYTLGRVEEAESLAARATTSFESAGQESGCVRSLNLRATIATARRGYDAALALQDEALTRARAGGLRLATEEILSHRAALLMESGRWKDGVAALDEGLLIALQDGRPRGVAMAYANLVMFDAFMGRPVRARRRARTAMRLVRSYLPRMEPTTWRARSQAYRVSGRLAAAERAARAAISGAQRQGIFTEVEWAQLEFGRVRAAAGSWPEAEAVWENARRAAEGKVGPCPVLLAIACGRARVRRRDYSGAVELLAGAERALEGNRFPFATACAMQLGAELALAQGHAESGVGMARETLAAFAALPAPADRAAAALDFARLATVAAVNAPVDEWLEQAAGTFERLGDHRGREKSLALAVEWLRSARAATPRAQHRDLLRSVSRLIDSLADLGELTRRAMQLAVEQLDAERGVLLLVDEKSGALEPVVEQGAVDAATRSQAVTYSRQAVARVAASGGSLLIPNVSTDPDGLSASMVDLRLRSIVCVPLYGAGKVVGAVYLDDSRRSETFSDADRALLEGFAHLVAIAIEKSRGQEEERRTHERLVGENLSLRQEVSVRFQPQNFVGMSSAMQKVLSMAERAAQTATTVLITGENGTGKEMIARVIHHSGKRRTGPFVSINCGAIPQTLLESELFGILPSVATGVRGRDGRFVQANGGTLFLDEIGDMPLPQQVALLSALSNREITPVGGGKPIAVDVRVIAATNQDLRKRIEEGEFREDLFYRLNVLPIEVPPLRDRKADIPSLAHFFAAHFAGQQERDVPDLSPEFLAALMQSDWPGNVRELQNYVERVMAMTPGRILAPSPLPRDLETRAGRPRIARGRHMRDQIADLERELIREALERSAGNQSRAARELGMTEQTFRYRLKKLSPSDRKNRRGRKDSR